MVKKQQVLVHSRHNLKFYALKKSLNMAARNRNSENRDEFLLETNFDDDGALTRAHFNNTNNRNGDNNGSSLNRPQPRPYRSNYSIDRYSDAGRSYKEGEIYLCGALLMSARNDVSRTRIN